MPSLFPQLFAFEQLAPLVLRLALGAAFITRGWPKLFRHFQGTAEFFETMDLRPARAWVLVLGVAELFGGILLVLGFLTQLAALILAVDILGRWAGGNIWKNWRSPFSALIPTSRTNFTPLRKKTSGVLKPCLLRPGKWSASTSRVLTCRF